MFEIMADILIKLMQSKIETLYKMLTMFLLSAKMYDYSLFLILMFI